MKHTLFFSIILIMAISSLSAGKEEKSPYDIKPGRWLRNVKVEYEEGSVKGRGLVQIYFPKNYTGGSKARTLIVLHGYRQQPSDWENGTPVTEYADRYGFVLACPAMTTTLYESRYFPETVNRWAPQPGGVFISKTLIEFLKKNFGLAKDRGTTGIFGISTGARGAVLLAAQHRKIFGAAAGLSGDYDSESIKNDRLLISVYGYYESNKERWEEEVNIIKLAENLKKTPVFLGHGTNDGVVPPPQTTMLADRLMQLAADKGGYEVVVDSEKSKGAGHDWKYWGSLVPEVFAFFDKKLGK
ncbi:MAG: prolyl oligopeptidase family serine peptidase [Spirochaetes bacterium]|nr:prolyl oligopeptidase family serine peptidase [Spirochaetota bacterium]